MAPLRYTAKFDPFLSLDCARVEGRKGSNFAIWQHRERGPYFGVLQRHACAPLLAMRVPRAFDVVKGGVIIRLD